MELKGKYNTAKVFTSNIEQEAVSQIVQLLDQEVFKGCKIRIMPDAHAGKGCVIGFTADLRKKVIPNLVGVDIGCGILAVNLGNIDIDFDSLDKFIREEIPHGFDVNKKPQVELEKDFCQRLKKVSGKVGTDFNRDILSIGSLGGGNHFIEIGVDKDGNKWLTVHSGSRNLGHQIATYHQGIAVKYCQKKPSYRNLPRDLCFLENTELKEYLEDMRFAQEYAERNRRVIAAKILDFLGFKLENLHYFSTIHNYIDFKDMIIRKGAISAAKGEKVVIPINMRDGSIIAVGKGNADWNNSAPHGAGRLMSRKKARKSISLKEYKESMKNIWSTSVKKSTVDEAPMAYKPIDEIMENIEETVEIIDIIRPLYNFKA